jgi:hypothetical protein
MLQSPDDTERPNFMATLGLLPPYMPEDVEKAYLARVKEIRPDLGGDPRPFYELQSAYTQAKEYLKFRGDRRGWIAKRMDEYVAMQAVVGQLTSLGAKVETNFLGWLRKSFGDFAELTEKIVVIRFNDAANGDEFIDYLVTHADELMELERLDLAGTNLTDGAVRQLGVLRSLRSIDLSRTPITWQALHIIEWLPELQSLDVAGTSLNWFTRRRLKSQLSRKRKAAESARVVHPLSVR